MKPGGSRAVVAYGRVRVGLGVGVRLGEVRMMGMRGVQRRRSSNGMVVRIDSFLERAASVGWWRGVGGVRGGGGFLLLLVVVLVCVSVGGKALPEEEEVVVVVAASPTTADPVDEPCSEAECRCGIGSAKRKSDFLIGRTCCCRCIIADGSPGPGW